MKSVGLSTRKAEVKLKLFCLPTKQGMSAATDENYLQYFAVSTRLRRFNFEKYVLYFSFYLFFKTMTSSNVFASLIFHLNYNFNVQIYFQNGYFCRVKNNNMPNNKDQVDIKTKQSEKTKFIQGCDQT